jgi:hypothetical protein
MRRRATVSTVAWREDGAMCIEYWAVFGVETTLETVKDRGSGLVDVSSVLGSEFVSLRLIGLCRP